MIWVYNYKHPDCLLFLKIGTTLAIFMLAWYHPRGKRNVENVDKWASNLWNFFFY